jgi:hypothetical protein
MSVAGRSAPPARLPIVNTNGLASNFFRAMELPLVMGRDFSAADTGAAPRVAIVNQAFVRQYFDGQNPIGEHLVIPNYGERVEVIGVSADAKYTELRTATPPTVYFPALQQVDGNANFAVRIGGPNPNAGPLFPAIRSAVREIDPALPVLDLRTQDEQIDRLHGQELLFAKLSGFLILRDHRARAGVRRPLRAAVARRAAAHRRDRLAHGARRIAWPRTANGTR